MQETDRIRASDGVGSLDGCIDVHWLPREIHFMMGIPLFPERYKSRQSSRPRAVQLRLFRRSSSILPRHIEALFFFVSLSLSLPCLFYPLPLLLPSLPLSSFISSFFSSYAITIVSSRSLLDLTVLRAVTIHLISDLSLEGEALRYTKDYFSFRFNTAYGAFTLIRLTSCYQFSSVMRNIYRFVHRVVHISIKSKIISWQNIFSRLYMKNRENAII